MKNYPACRVKTFSIISSGGNIVQQSGTVCAMLLEGIIENFCILLNLGQLKYRSTLLCQTCLSRIHGICRSDHPFPSISPILLCISNLFMSNLVIRKSRLYRSGFSFPKISFPLLYHYLCQSKFFVGQKTKQYECQTKHLTFIHRTIAFNSVQYNPLLQVIAN